MSRMALYLLGPPRIERDGAVLHLDRRKAIALLAYLAVTGRRHRRDSLVNLLWPEVDTAAGRAALRRTLHALNAALGGEWLDAGREEIELSQSADVWVDVVEFRRRLAECARHGHLGSDLCAECIPPLSAAVELVHGEFLSGFGLKDSPNFDDWQLFQAEAVRRELGEALAALVRWHTGRRDLEPALGYARRRLALDPLDEEAHRELMRLYAWSGRRSAAVQQYEECAAILRDQLGMSPQDATRQLREEIQAGRAPPLPAAGAPAAGPPAFLGTDREAVRPVFVARERELARLDSFLQLALAGQGRVAFVTGDAGSGKTALIQAFALRAQAANPDLVVAGGSGNAHTGSGDAYLPFREVLALLTGDLEAPWAAGAMTSGQANRLWRLLPAAVDALARSGPDLIGVFVRGEPLLERVRMGTPRPDGSVPVSRVEELVARGSGPGFVQRLQQSALFEQYVQVLRALAARHPLLLTLDDLQWADGGSLSLLFHLARRLAGSRILVLGAYRPTDLALGQPPALVAGEPTGGAREEARERRLPGDGRHPLEPIVNELKRAYGEIEVDVEPSPGRPFVDALLDSEPNRLGAAFREALHKRTQGHPLFTVELLRGMQERGDLARDPQGRWIEGPELDWETLPARVEAVIAERIARLPHRLQGLLAVASVEGDAFTAEVIARAGAADERSVLRWLSDTLDKKHRLVGARGMVRTGSQRLAQYRFRHILYQRYVYGRLDAVERADLHERVGTALEGLYASGEIASVAVQLGRHFEAAGLADKAIEYLRQAGERSCQLSAYQEGLAHLTRALSLLMALPSGEGRDRMELDLRLALGVAQQGVKGTQSTEMRDAYIRARELCERLGETAHLCHVLGELALHHFTRAEHQTAREQAEQALDAALQTQDPLLEALSRWSLAIILFFLGEVEAAQEHLGWVTAFYVPEQHQRAFLVLRGSDAGVSAMAYSACALWCLGYPDQALEWSRKALALARELDHPFTLADVLAYGGCVFNQMLGDAKALKASAEALTRLADEKVEVWTGTGDPHLGAAWCLLGQNLEGLARIRAGIAILRSRGVHVNLSGALAAQARAQAQAGRVDEGLASLDEALAFVERTGERHFEAELYRLRGELLLAQGHEAEAEASLQRAIEVARARSARSWELRATMSLARLWHSLRSQDRAAEARERLSAIYGRFSEGFDTPDLKEARSLLEELH